MSHTFFLNPYLPTDVEGLRFGSTDARPVQVSSWDSEALINDEWTFYEGYTAQDVKGAGDVVMIAVGGSPLAALMTFGDETVAFESHEWDDYETECDDREMPEQERIPEDDWDLMFEQEPASAGAEGPMMNYWYPCPAAGDDPVVAAARLASLPLCVVEVDGEWGLALTGGGMDLTWSIVEAYVRLGQLPPAHYAAAMIDAHGGSFTADEAFLVGAALRTLRHVADRAQSDHDRLFNAASKWSGGRFTGTDLAS